MTRGKRFRTLLSATALSTLGLGLLATTAFAGDISGSVTDAATKKPIAGANIAISGTAFTATTDASGAYVLKDVPAGQYKIEANAADYQIGEANQVVPATGDATLNFSGYKTDSTQVVIVANRFSAKTMQIKSENSISVLSAADLQHTAVHNAAEVLGLMPSVNVMMTGNSFIGGIDGASRGEGQYVSIRSMNSEYNVNLINGVEVATAQPYSRGVQLNLIPPGGLQTVVLNKSSMANMDGDAIGGTIDFRTPTAFDYHGKQSGSVSVSGNYESQAHDLHAKGDGYAAGADFQRKFGADENFGVYASAYYSLRNYANSEFGGAMEAYGGDRAYDYAFVDANGNIPAGMDPTQDLQLTGFNVGVSSGRTELVGGTLSLDWRPDTDTTYYVHGTFAHDQTTQNSSLNQVVGEQNINKLGVSPFNADGSLNANYIAVGSGSSTIYQTKIPAVSNRLWYETNPERASLSTLSIGMRKQVGAWHIEPSVFYSYGRNDRPNHMELWTTSIPVGNASPAAAPFGATSIVTYDSNNFAVPHLTPGMEYTARNPGTMPAPCCYELTSGLSDQTKSGARIDVSYDFDRTWLQSISFGAKYVASKRDVSNRDWTVSEPSPAASLGQDTQILTGYYPGFPGKYDYLIPQVNHPELRNRFNTLTNTPALRDAASDICTSGSTALGVYINNNCNTLSGTEDVSSAYVMAKFAHDDIEIIPGLRYESTDIKNTYFVRNFATDAQGNTTENTSTDGFQSNTAHFSKFLPSLFLNYRPASGAVYRASVWTSYTRPPLFQLGGSSSTTYSASTNTTTIVKGNPDLKAIDAVNFDASGTWRNKTGGYLSVGLFYKKLQHYIYDSGSGYVANSDTSASGATLISQPRNGGNATVSGIEIDAQQKLDTLPAPLDGFSLGGNLTLQNSKADIGTSWGHKERMQNAPNITGNFGIYYAKNALSVDVTYHYSGEYISNYDMLGKGATYDDLWVRPVQTLNLHAGYDFGKVKLDMSVANLLKDYSYWSHIGHHSLAISDIIQSGRTALVTLKYDF